MYRSHETRVVNVKLILIIQIRWANKIKQDEAGGGVAPKRLREFYTRLHRTDTLDRIVVSKIQLKGGRR